jgi:hypothetical protein
MLRRLSLVVLPLVLVACGGFDGSATQKLELKDSDIESGTLSQEKELDDGNSTWKDFLASAKTELGSDATALSVRGVKVAFDTTKAKNVGKFEDVVKGDFVVSLRIKDTNEIIDVAKVASPTGSGTVELTVTKADLAATTAKLTPGQFKVGVRASTDKTKGADFTLPVVITFDLTAK